MKKLYRLLLLVIVCLTGSGLYAQNFGEGSQFVQAGVGFGSGYIGSGLNGGLPPVHISYEMGITENIGVGGLIGFTTAKSGTLFGGGEYRYSYTVLGARGAYHFYNQDKIDAYGGIMLGYNLASVKYTGNNTFLANSVSAGGGLAYGFFVGGRYFVNDKVHLMAEVGYSIAYISLGAGITL